MLLVPLITGAAVGNPHGQRVLWILLFTAAVLSLFCLRTPLEAALGWSSLRPQNDGERRLIYCCIFFYASASVLCLGVLMLRAQAHGLLLPGTVAAAALALQTYLMKFARPGRVRAAEPSGGGGARLRPAEARLNAQLAGAVALSSTAAGTYYLATGHLGAVAAIAWLANWLFAADQIHFVQLRIHSARAASPAEKLRHGKGFVLHQAACLAFLGVIWRAGWLPGLVLVAFGGLFIRGCSWFFEAARPLRVRRLGISELLYAVVFGAFFIISFHIRG